MSNAELKAILTLKDEATKKLARFQKHIHSAAKIIKQAFIPVTAAILGSVYAMKKATDALVRTSSQAEQLRIRLKVLLGSVEEGNKVFKDMSELASQVPKTYDEIMEAATSLAAVVRGGSEEVKRLMPLIVDLSAATGISVRDVTSQMIRMYSAGAASADMFRERGVLAMLGFQAGVSYTAEETMKQVVAAWESATSKFRGASKELAQSWEGLTSMLSDAWFQFKLAVGEKIFKTVKKDMQTILLFIQKSKEEGGKYNEVVKKMGGIFVDAYSKAKDFGAFLIISAGQAIDIWNDLKASVNAVALGLMNIYRFSLKFDIMRIFGSPEEKAEAKAHLEDISTWIAELEKDLVLLAAAGMEDFSTRFRNILNEMGTQFQQLKSEIADIAEEGITGAPAGGEAPEEEEAEESQFIKKQKEGIDTLRTIWQAWNDEKLSMEMRRIQAETEFYNLAIDTQKKATESMWVSIGKMRDTFSKGMSTMLVDIMKRTADVKEAFKNLGWQMVQILIDFGVQKIVNAALSKALHATQIAVSAAAAAATAASWAPAAAMVSLATMGGNAGPAGAALSSITALAQALTIPRLKEGGEIEWPGRVMVGEEGPEILDLPRGAVVSPLNRQPQLVPITREINVYIDHASFNREEDVKETMEMLFYLIDERRRARID